MSELEAETIKRLNDYRRSDATKHREALVALWRAHHPAAAAEPPWSEFHPLILMDGYRKEIPESPDEYWHNDIYTVSLRRREDKVFGSAAGMIQLGISSLDGTARHDWRDFQAIKNQLAGPECEAFELYPAESRLLDPSNYYTLWCFPGVKRLKVGKEEGRRVWDADQAMAPQRALPRQP